jgi:carbonic anhydrase
MRTQTEDTLKKLTPHKILDILKEGNKRFVKNLQVDRNLLHQVNETSEAQYPFAAILSCIDSRTSAELIFDQGLGDIFSIRIAGNIVNADILGSMELACKVSGSKLIVVLGHTRCGAIVNAYRNFQLGHITSLLEKIRPVIRPEDYAGQEDETIPTGQIAIRNVHQSIEKILEGSAIISEMYHKGEIGIVGALYDVQTGIVTFYDELFEPGSLG